TRPPTCATLIANAAAIVDLPSSGTADVTPTALLTEIPFKSAASLIVRMASAKRENGCSMILDTMPSLLDIRGLLGPTMVGGCRFLLLFVGSACRGIKSIHGRPSIVSI